MASIVKHVRSHVRSRDYYDMVFPKINWPGGSTEARVHCLFHNEKTPSLSLNPETGAWFCHGCDVGGRSILSFHALLHECTHREAAESIFATLVRPVIDDRLVRRWARELRDTPSALKYLKQSRLISQHVIDEYKIGWTGDRFTIPILNEFDIYVNAKLYDPLAKQRGSPKMLNYSHPDEDRSFGSPPMFYPLSSFQIAEVENYIIICEGEWDALALLSLGLPAITTTAGSKSWASQYNEMFRGLEVTIAYDNDKDGITYSRKIINHLMPLAKTIKRLQIPKRHGKDVTDWLRKQKHMRNPDKWLNIIQRTKTILTNPDSLIAPTEQVESVPLDRASESRWIGRTIEVQALVSGKGMAPYVLPQRYRVTCSQQCDNCPLAERSEDHREIEIPHDDPLTLQLIDSPEFSVNKALIARARFPNRPLCNTQIQHVESFNVEQLILIPTIESRSQQYVTRSSYYTGHGLRPNRAYRFVGATVAHPKNQSVTHLFTHAEPVQDEIETFELSDELKRELKRFCPTGAIKPLGHLMSIAEWQSRHITKIRERPDLHVAVDLAFHSVPEFTFNEELIPRGMLDILVLGDTRCGKGFVTERLTKYYGMGEVASGESCTFAGLIGGLKQYGNQWVLNWGLIPLNNGRLVVIDETSALSTKEIGAMSRVRSEGIAEITKIVREVTQANARLIWLANPRSGRSIMMHNTGIEAVKELIGANEDISRFDFVMTVATDEVSSEIINAPADYRLDDVDKFPPDLCRSLILWSWSRKPDQVKFTKGATLKVIRESIKFGRRYSPVIPLVQAENIRIKIAKISAAVAARLFSCDETCEKIIVTSSHVKCACDFLEIIYSKPSMAYNVFSATSGAIHDHQDSSKIDEIFVQVAVDRKGAVQGLLELRYVSENSLGDMIGDRDTARLLITKFLAARCLQQTGNESVYHKTPAFLTWLRRQQEMNNVRPTSKR